MAELTQTERDQILAARERINMEKQAKQKILSDKKSGKFTYAAGILSTVFFSCYIVLHAILTIAGWTKGELYRSGELIVAKILTWLFSGIIESEGAIGVISWIFGVAYVITLIIFSNNLIIDSKKSLREYKKSTGPMITYVCFFFAWLCVPFSMIFGEDGIVPIGLLAIVMVLLIIVFVVVDLFKASQEYETTQESNPSKIGFVANKNEINDVENEIRRLEKLKEQNLISEEEYKILRSKIIK